MNGVQSQYQRIVLCLLGLILTLGCGSKQKVHGTDSIVKSQPIAVSQALQPVNFGRNVRLQGAVKALCSDDNCWLVLNDAANMMRIEFDESHLSPPEGIEGMNIIVEGKIIEKIISPTSSGYDEYEKSCGIVGGGNTKGDQRVPVFVAYRLEIQ